MARGDQLSRQWKLLQILLSSQQSKSVAELSHALGCHHRTVYRDLEALQHAGFPLYDEREEGKSRWRLLDTFSRQVPIPFALTELMALYFSRDLLGVFKDTLFHDAFVSLIRKVKALLPPDSIAYLEKVEKAIHVNSGPHAPYGPQKRLLADLHQAVRERSYIEIHYYAMSTRTLTKRQVAPYKIWLFNGSFYLIGNCSLRQDIRIFAVERIQKLRLLERHFELDEDFDIGTIMQQSFGVYRDRRVDVKIRFSSHVAGYIKEKVWHSSQKIQLLENGDILFQAQVAGWQEIKNWVLQWGADAVVVEPTALRDTIKSVALAMTKHYP